MSLLRWLAATRSINSVQDKPSPYRMLQPNLLPKFGTPARGRTRAQEDESEDKNKRKEETAKEHENKAPEPEQKNENPAVAELVHAKAVETKERGWKFWRKWTRTKRPKLAPVQTELDLDTVRVVRNDLSDSDLEVVTKPKAKKVAEPKGEEGLADAVAVPTGVVGERCGGATAPYRGEAPGATKRRVM